MYGYVGVDGEGVRGGASVLDAIVVSCIMIRKPFGNCSS